ncbi:MAG: AlpA family phage regulatory protein [Aeromicrobium sp.]|nr:AlpA family phage regulatory protein [Burkholderiales bacterium]
MEKQLLRLSSVLKKTGQSRAAWYAAVKKGIAPRQVKINGGRAAAWVGSEIDDYIDRLISERDAAQQLLAKLAGAPAADGAAAPERRPLSRAIAVKAPEKLTLRARAIAKVV